MSESASGIFHYLARRDDSLAPADLIIGFGHFDPRIPHRCGEIWLAQRSDALGSRILFTGGIGAGTADLQQPEALFFRDRLQCAWPEIPASAVLVEPHSTHTGENITFSEALLRRVSPEVCFERGIAHVVLVATPARQRRVFLACRKHWPHLHLSCAPPLSTFDEDRELFAAKGRNLETLLLGEMHRLLTYPALGFIADPDIPRFVLEAYYELKSQSTHEKGSR